MARNLTPEELVAALTAIGVGIPEDLNEKVANATEDKAFHYIVPKLSVPEDEVTDTATEWQERLFTLAEDVEANFTGETKNRGQGQRVIRFLSVETHAGTLKVELSQAV